MREFEDGYDFSHDLLRETAYAAISPPKRWLLHRRIAQGLELLHAEDTDAVAAQLAEQYARGGRPVRALAYYQRAAGVAASRFAHAEAIRLHEKALSIIAAMPAGRDRDSRELAVLEAMAAPLNASAATRHRSCSEYSNGRSTSGNHLAAEIRRSPAWSRSGRRSSFKGASLMDTRRPPVR